MQKSLSSICNLETEKGKTAVPISLSEQRGRHRRGSVCHLTPRNQYGQ